VAIDADTYKPDCGWHEFVRGRDLPETLVQRTARGGLNYVHTAPAGEAFPGTLCAGVEIKHEGYIVVEPSVFEGKPYRFENDAEPAPVPEWVAIAALIDELTALGPVRIGLDVVGGIAGLAEAMLAEAGFPLVHVPGLAVNRARQGTVGGEHKSDPRDARIIAEQVRVRRDLRRIEPATELDLELRLLVGRRRDLVDAQTQRLPQVQ
jgi:hypothetical protein